MIQVGGLFLVVGGFAIACFAMFAAIVIVLRLYLGFEAWCEREREPQASDDELGDIPNLNSFIFHSAPVIDGRQRDHA